MKMCSICKQVKSYGDFYKRSALKSGYQSACKLCNNVRLQNKVYRKRAVKRAGEYRKKIKQTHTPCFFCGNDDLRCLEFHHIKPRSSKKRAVETAVERNKCVSLCGNCHNILHYESRKRHNGTTT